MGNPDQFCGSGGEPKACARRMNPKTLDFHLSCERAVSKERRAGEKGAPASSLLFLTAPSRKRGFCPTVAHLRSAIATAGLSHDSFEMGMSWVWDNHLLSPPFTQIRGFVFLKDSLSCLSEKAKKWESPNCVCWNSGLHQKKKSSPRTKKPFSSSFAPPSIFHFLDRVLKHSF